MDIYQAGMLMNDIQPSWSSNHTIDELSGYLSVCSWFKICSSKL